MAPIAESHSKDGIADVDYLIESFFVVSVDMVESVDIVEAESEDMVEVESVTVVDDSVDSVFELEQAVVSAIIESRKNAYLAMIFIEIEVVNHFLINP